MCEVAKVSLGGSCILSEECLDEFASCVRGLCRCQPQYFNQNNRCGRFISLHKQLGRPVTASLKPPWRRLLQNDDTFFIIIITLFPDTQFSYFGQIYSTVTLVLPISTVVSGVV